MSEDIHILKVASCPSLSGRSTLTYHIGCKGEEIYIHLFANSGLGLFSKEWISVEQFELSKEGPISSSSLHAFFKGKSANTGGFLMAALKDLGLIQPIEEKSRTYRRCDPAPFKAAIVALMESEVVLETTPPRQKKGRK